MEKEKKEAEEAEEKRVAEELAASEPLIPRKTKALIVANSKYDKWKGYPDLTFTKAEIERIEPLFRKLTEDVEVWENPSF